MLLGVCFVFASSVCEELAEFRLSDLSGGVCVCLPGDADGCLFFDPSDDKKKPKKKKPNKRTPGLTSRDTVELPAVSRKRRSHFKRHIHPVAVALYMWTSSLRRTYWGCCFLESPFFSPMFKQSHWGEIQRRRWSTDSDFYTQRIKSSHVTFKFSKVLQMKLKPSHSSDQKERPTVGPRAQFSQMFKSLSLSLASSFLATRLMTHGLISQ